MKLQHRTRREGGVSVGRTRYDLSEQGVVEVSEEHAKRMLQGKAWRVVPPDGSMPWPEAPPSPPMLRGAAGRRPRTREELLGLADTEGVPVPEEGPKAFDQYGRALKPSESKPNYEDMSREELVEICKSRGIEIPRYSRKPQLLELIQGE